MFLLVLKISYLMSEILFHSDMRISFWVDVCENQSKINSSVISEESEEYNFLNRQLSNYSHYCIIERFLLRDQSFQLYVKS